MLGHPLWAGPKDSEKIVWGANDYTELDFAGKPYKIFRPVGHDDSELWNYPLLEDDVRWRIPAMSHPSGDTSSDVAFSRMRYWLQECQDTHQLCGKDHNAGLPHRILRIESTTRLKLVENVQGNDKYACLSHRWGTGPHPLCLERSNLYRFKIGIPHSSLPALFQDVQAAVWRLGIRYMWIDSLCIIQDDPDDWRREAASMAAVYENAYFTIAATGSDGCSDPLFKTMEPVADGSPAMQIGHSGFYVSRSWQHPWRIHSREAEDWQLFPLLSRGWVYQERLLSRRFIYFTTNEVMWECRESRRCECRFEERRFKKEPKPGIRDLSWTEAVEYYTLLSLSKSSDRLPAIAGIAKRHHSLALAKLEYPENRKGRALKVEDRLRALMGMTRKDGLIMPGKYLAGCWEHHIKSDLLWCMREGFGMYSSDYARVFQVRPRPQPRVAPTWSWASVNAAITFHSGKCTLLRVLRWDMQPLGPDDYGEMQSALLTISGYVVPATLYYGIDYQDIKRTVRPHPNSFQTARVEHSFKGIGKWDGWGQMEDGIFELPRATDRSKDLELNSVLDDNGEGGRHGFGLLVGRKLHRKYPFAFAADYSMQKSGVRYVESGAQVLCLICGSGIVTKYAYEIGVEFCLVLRCVDNLLGHYERIGRLVETQAVLRHDWLKWASRTELTLV